MGVGSLWRVEASSHRPDERIGAVWFLEVGQSVDEAHSNTQDIDAVTAGKDDFEVFLIGPEFFGQLFPGQTAGHDHVRQQKVEVGIVVFPKVKSLNRIGGCVDLETGVAENIAGEIQDAFFVFDREDPFAGADGLPECGVLGIGFGDFLCTGRKKDCEGGALVWNTGDLDPSVVLFDDPVDHCEAHSPALA